MWNLWLDDERPCPHPNGEWKIARSTDEAKILVNEFGPPERMSLDHDLGGNDTTMVFLKWLSSHHFADMPLWRVHSANPPGKANLESFMQSWAKSI